jgi:hypothetical protein
MFCVLLALALAGTGAVLVSRVERLAASARTCLAVLAAKFLSEEIVGGDEGDGVLFLYLYFVLHIFGIYF